MTKYRRLMESETNNIPEPPAKDRTVPSLTNYNTWVRMTRSLAGSYSR